jgi:hypothetical protein
VTDTTIREVIAKKRELEHEVSKLLLAFTYATGLRVEGIETHYTSGHELGSEAPVYVHYETTARVEVP